MCTLAKQKMLLESKSKSIFVSLVCDVRQKCHLARSFNSGHHLALVRRADTRRAARQNLATLRHKAAKLHGVLVIYVSCLVDAKLAYLTAALTHPAGIITIFGHW